MRARRIVGAVAVAMAAVGAAVLPGAPAHAASSCSPWSHYFSYSGPASGGLDDQWMRVCIQKAATGEYFAGDMTVYNGATVNGQYNSHYGSRYVRFGTAGGEAMTGHRLGYNNASKILKGTFGDPTNNCYYGELMPGYQITCASAWVLDNSPASANFITGYAYVGAWFWQAGMSKWEWGEGVEVLDSPYLN
jgi:hypothetical protein